MDSTTDELSLSDGGSEGQGTEASKAESSSISQKEARQALLKGFGDITGRTASTPTGVAETRVQAVTPYQALDSNTSRAPGANPESATDLNPEDEAPLPDAYKQAKLKVQQEITELEDKLPKRGRKRLLKLQPFRFTVTIKAEPPYYPRFHIWYIKNILKDVFGTNHDDNNYCAYDVINCYTLHDKNVTHYSVDLYADLDELLMVLYRLDYTCRRYEHTYDHTYRMARYDNEQFERWLDQHSTV